MTQNRVFHKRRGGAMIFIFYSIETNIVKPAYFTQRINFPHIVHMF